MSIDETYMQRCLDLAKKGMGSVSPNPMVGAVLVYENTVIGEGYHQQYGQAHAEVNCINSVAEVNKHLIAKSTLYVSLEPCSHFGKTPPCSNLIIDNKIPRVVIACSDTFEQVNGQGIEQLKSAGIQVQVGVLENEALQLNKRFFTFHTKKRPYIILKWAQSSNGKIANADFSRVLISNDFTNKLVHRWRSEEDAILVGTNTALYDNPSLTTRNWTGKNPLRLLLDKDLRLPTSLHLFDNTTPTIVFNATKSKKKLNLSFEKISFDSDVLKEILDKLYQLNITSVIVEGGQKLLQSFLQSKNWDEVRIITNEALNISNGIDAPSFFGYEKSFSETLLSDRIDYYCNK